MLDDKTHFQDIKSKIKEFVDARNWDKDHNPKNLSMSIAIEAAELMEIFQWNSIEEGWAINKSDEYEHFKEELADVLIYCISLANQLDIDITDAIYDKMGKNALRFPVCK